MQFSIEITFNESRSTNYRDTLKNARNFNEFTTHPNRLYIDRLDELFAFWTSFTVVLFNSVKWTGTHVYFCGEIIAPYTSAFYYVLQDLKQCYEYCRSIDNKASYCAYSWWGCRRIRSVVRYIGNSGLADPMWYDFGKYTDATTWQVDKDQMTRVLMAGADNSMAVHCPYFSADRVRKEVGRLPDQLKIGQYWQPTYKLDYLQDGPIYVQSGIVHAVDMSRLPPPVAESEFSAGDVSPENLPNVDRFLDEILQKRKKRPE
jgi:hypothetical protein